jgi:hypothetical protein
VQLLEGIRTVHKMTGLSMLGNVHKVKHDIAPPVKCPLKTLAFACWYIYIVAWRVSVIRKCVLIMVVPFWIQYYFYILYSMKDISTEKALLVCWYIGAQIKQVGSLSFLPNVAFVGSGKFHRSMVEMRIGSSCTITVVCIPTTEMDVFNTHLYTHHHTNHA